MLPVWGLGLILSSLNVVLAGACGKLGRQSSRPSRELVLFSSESTAGSEGFEGWFRWGTDRCFHGDYSIWFRESFSG